MAYLPNFLAYEITSPFVSLSKISCMVQKHTTLLCVDHFKGTVCKLCHYRSLIQKDKRVSLMMQWMIMESYSIGTRDVRTETWGFHREERWGDQWWHCSSKTFLEFPYGGGNEPVTDIIHLPLIYGGALLINDVPEELDLWLNRTGTSVLSRIIGPSSGNRWCWSRPVQTTRGNPGAPHAWSLWTWSGFYCGLDTTFHWRSSIGRVS